MLILREGVKLALGCDCGSGCCVFTEAGDGEPGLWAGWVEPGDLFGCAVPMIVAVIAAGLLFAGLSG